VRISNPFLISINFVVLLAGFSSSTLAQQPTAATNATSSKFVADTKPRAGASSNEFLKETISFRFDIAGLKTNHQFEGQLNTFHVEYEYSGRLKSGGYDPKGHSVSADSFPYFQSVRNDIIKFATEYSDKSDFYEIFGTKICEFVMHKYPQIRKITLSIDVPAFKDVDVDRGETITIVRQGTPRSAHP
jgi:hypothetical protein